MKLTTTKAKFNRLSYNAYRTSLVWPSISQ